MFNADRPTQLLISFFVIVVVAAAVMIAGGAGQGNISKALRRAGVVVVAVCVLGFAGLGVTLMAFGKQILSALGFELPAG